MREIAAARSCLLQLLRELLADGVVDDETADILESVLAAVDEADGAPARESDLFEALVGATQH